MTDHASQEEIIEVPAKYVLETILEIDHYPLWIEDVKDVKVFERDENGRALRAELHTFALGKNLIHEHTYDYSDYPHSISWNLIKGDMVSELYGSYTINPIDEHSTNVRYELNAKLSTPLPGFMKRKATNHIVSSALKSLKSYCETKFV